MSLIDSSEEFHAHRSGDAPGEKYCTFLFQPRKRDRCRGGLQLNSSSLQASLKKQSSLSLITLPMRGPSKLPSNGSLNS